MRQSRYLHYVEVHCTNTLIETWLMCTEHMPGTAKMFLDISKQFGAKGVLDVKDEDLEQVLVCYSWLAIWLRRKMLKYKYAKSLK